MPCADVLPINGYASINTYIEFHLQLQTEWPLGEEPDWQRGGGGGGVTAGGRGRERELEGVVS